MKQTRVLLQERERLLVDTFARHFLGIAVNGNRGVGEVEHYFEVPEVILEMNPFGLDSNDVRIDELRDDVDV